MATSAPHIVAVPGWFLIIRVLQIILAVATLGIAGYLTSLVPVSGFALALFTAIATLIIVVYNLVASRAIPNAYNYWAVLALEIFAVVFWLGTMGIVASYAAAIALVFGYSYGSYDSYYDSSCNSSYYYCNSKRALHDLTKRATTGYSVSMGLIGGAAGIAALEFIFFLVTLIAFGVFLHRHRKSGGPNLAPGSYNMNNPGPGPEKTGAQAHVHNIELSPA